MRRKLRTREGIASWMVSTWQDAISLHYTWDVLMNRFRGIRESRDYQKLTRIDKAYVEGFQRCYDLYTIQRSCTESGSWVVMPDGSEVYFGVRERLHMSNAQLDAHYPMLAEYGIHRYIYEHKIAEKSGIYWSDSGQWNGKYPFFIPAIHSSKTTESKGDN